MNTDAQRAALAGLTIGHMTGGLHIALRREKDAHKLSCITGRSIDDCDAAIGACLRLASETPLRPSEAVDWVFRFASAGCGLESIVATWEEWGLPVMAMTLDLLPGEFAAWCSDFERRTGAPRPDTT